MLILTPFSHIPCSNEISQQNSRLSFFSKSVFQGAEGVDLVGTIKKRICYTCGGIDHMVTAEKL